MPYVYIVRYAVILEYEIMREFYFRTFTNLCLDNCEMGEVKLLLWDK